MAAHCANQGDERRVKEQGEPEKQKRRDLKRERLTAQVLKDYKMLVFESEGDDAEEDAPAKPLRAHDHQAAGEKKGRNEGSTTKGD